MNYTTVAVGSMHVRRDGVLRPGYVYISSNEAALAARNLGLYDVWTQPGVNPFPVWDADWLGTLSDSDVMTVNVPAELETDLRELCAVQERSYIMYYFRDFSMTGSGVDVYVQDRYSIPSSFIYEVDISCGRHWYRATRFTYRRPWLNMSPVDWP